MKFNNTPSDDNRAMKLSRSSLQKQLNSKSRLTAFPLSFLRREKVFRSPLSNREFRTSGSCKVTKGFFGIYRDTHLQLENSYLTISPRDSDSSFSSKKLNLVGASLAVLSNSKFTISTKKHTFYFKCENELECSQWLYSFQQVPGLYRRIEDFFEIGEIFGEGATCIVHECFNKLTGERFALKKRKDPLDELGRQGLYNELRILQLMTKNPHPAIPRLEDHFYDRKGDIQLVMEFLSGGELSTKIETELFLEETTAREIFFQVADGVRHLHENCIAHRDLKPTNIMLQSPSLDQNYKAKIIDFDLAKANYAEHWFGMTLCGTPEFMAPEICQRKMYSLAVDVWSLGCVLFAMLTGHCLFKGDNSKTTRLNIVNGNFEFEDLKKVSSNARDLILKMLELCPEKRITVQEIMEHPWMKSSPVQKIRISHLIV